MNNGAYVDTAFCHKYMKSGLISTIQYSVAYFIMDGIILSTSYYTWCFRRREKPRKRLRENNNKWSIFAKRMRATKMIVTPQIMLGNTKCFHYKCIADMKAQLKAVLYSAYIIQWGRYKKNEWHESIKSLIADDFSLWSLRLN